MSEPKTFILLAILAILAVGTGMLVVAWDIIDQLRKINESLRQREGRKPQ